MKITDQDQFLDIKFCLLYTSDAADEEDSVDLGGRRIIKKKIHVNSYYENTTTFKKIRNKILS